MATNVDAALTEIAEKLAILNPQLEGLRDFERLNLHDDTRIEIEDSIAEYERRQGFLLTAQHALEDLVADGHPNLDAREIAQAAYTDLKENAATIEAAFAQFEPLTASNLQVAGGTPEPKAEPNQLDAPGE